ncbi:lipoate--protein ligase family protein [Enterococcus wangshanyuanii]|uniref:Lipoyl-[GcvH]:protein N-lipoyltransferase n=1 Tax=Enterococcus wangshanyuanii TaxID=2005703 RepID=A0ABQ1NWQ3_9ENTE|nr:lipoate--protein ligase family protein [Enterococcus wangshanyuanii]GGC81925.1 lipoyl-[GcvH]:protein N-lipoyltransferase [Enterococcus wangshanyuanii]
MNDLEWFPHFDSVYLYDQQCLTEKDYFLPFALTDVLTTFAGINQQPIIHFWQLDQAMILGMKDTRVTDLSAGLTSLRKAGYNSIVRNAGGLGVIADKGVLNVSLILPNTSDKKLSIDQGYTLMWEWIKHTFENTSHKINAFEVTESYCPGTFDLSIDGKKFAGIAQRRVKNGISVMIYLSVNGDQQKRSESVRDFYKASLGTDFGKNGYPPVNPDVMANLEDLLQTKLSVSDVKRQLLGTLISKNKITVNDQALSALFQTEWFITETDKQLEKMKQRNQLLR